MSDTNFVDYSTVIPASWLNDVNKAVYRALGAAGVAPTTAAQVLSNLGVSGTGGAGLVGTNDSYANVQASLNSFRASTGAGTVGTNDGWSNVQASLNARPQRVALYSNLQAITPTNAALAPTATVMGRTTASDGGGGIFDWVSGNQSANVTADPQNGIWVPPSSDTTGASGAWKRRYNDLQYPRWFGCKGDGVSDDTVALGSAIASVLSVGGKLCGNPGDTYKITAPISKSASSSNIVAEFDFTGTAIDATALTGAAGSSVALTIGGQVKTTGALSADVTAGATSLTMGGTQPVAGDVLLIVSTDVYNPYQTGSVKGELCRVLSVSGGVVNLVSPLYDSYAAATTNVNILACPQITLKNSRIYGNDNQIGCYVQYAQNIQSFGNKFYGFRYACHYLNFCYGAEVHGNQMWDFWYSGTGTSYGIGILSSQYIKVYGNTSIGGRHAITCGGTTPFRDIKIFSNTALGDTRGAIAGIETHANGQYIQIYGNTCSGILITSADTEAYDNDINTNANDIAGVNIFPTVSCNYWRVKRNRITCSGASTYGIWYSPSQASANVKELDLGDNVISSVASCILLSPRSSSATGNTIGRLSIVGDNALTSSANTALSIGISGAAFLTFTEMNVSGGYLDATNYDSIAMVAGTLCTKCLMDNVTVRANRNNGYIAQFCGTDVNISNCRFKGNTGGAGNSRSIRLINTGTAKIVGSTLENMSFVELDTGGPAKYYNRDNEFISCAANPLNTAGSQLLCMVTNSGKNIVSGTAIPTTGTWAVGDRVVNSAPAVGSPKAWTCTVAGTPGTWVSEGNL